MFNTLRYVKMLEEVGFSREQAETSTRILVDIMEDKLASKEDLNLFKTEMRSEFQEFKLVMKSDFEQFKSEMHNDFLQFKSEMRNDFQQFKSEILHLIAQSESKMTIRMGAMFAAAITILTAIQKLT